MNGRWITVAVDPATRHLSGFVWAPPTQDTGRYWGINPFIGDGKVQAEQV